MKYHESVLEDFTGFLFVDSRSNAFLNLTLVNVMGSVHGTISSINYTQVSIHTGCGEKKYTLEQTKYAKSCLNQSRSFILKALKFQ